MAKMPRPVRLFHITAIDNLPAIFEQGALYCKKLTQERGVEYQNIAHQGAQGARASKPVIDPPGGCIHDYVPFYFAPRSPMLMAIHKGQVVDCNYSQEDIVHFELLPRHAQKHGMAEFVFYDRNATKAYSEAYTDPKKLEEVVDWELLTEEPRLDGFCKYFQDQHRNPRYIDRMEKRQAEFLIKERVPLSWFSRVGVANREKADQVQRIIDQFGIELPVVVMSDWYFLGQ